MQEKDLVKGWGLVRPRRVMSDQISVRLPVDVWVGILALCNMFPGRTRTDIIGDLLASALERVREALPNERDPGEKEVSRGPFYGQRGRYEYLIDLYTKEFVQKGDWFIEGERKKRAPRGRGASVRPATKPRPAAAPGGDPQARKPGGRRRRAKG